MTQSAPALVSRKPLMLGLLVLITSIAFEAQAVSTAMPAAASDLGQLDLYAWAFSAFMIPQVVAIVVAGRLCDTVGPLRPAVAGIVSFAAGIVLAALAVSMPMLLAGRFVQGCGAGLTNVALMVIVGRVFAPHETGRVMTWFSFAWMLPSFVGPGLAAWLVKVSSWHMVFWAILPIVAIGVVLLLPPLVRLRLVGTPHRDAPHAPLWAAVCVAGGLALVQGAGQAVGWWSLPLVAVALAAFWFGTRPLMPQGWRPWGDGLSAVVAVRANSTGAFFATLSFLPLMVTTVKGRDLLSAGLVLTLASLGWTAGSWFQSRRWLRLSRDQIMTTGAALVALGLAGYTACVVWPGANLAAITACSIVAGSGMGLASSSTSILIMQLSQPQALGRNTSSLQVAEAMGNALVVGIAGAIFALLHLTAAPTVTFAWQGALVTLVATMSVVLSRRTGHVPNLSARP